MDRGTTVLQAFQSKLRAWLPVISRSVHGTAEILPTQNGEFFLEVKGKRKDGTEWAFSKNFTRELCFGSTFLLSPAAWQVVRRPCDHARDFIEEVLTYRGVL